MTARLSLLDQPQEESPWGDEHTSHHPIRETAPQGPSEPFSIPDGQHGSQGMHEQMPWQPSESTSSEGYQPSYAQQAQSNVTTSNSATHPPTTQSHALIDLEDDNQPGHSAQETNGNEIHRKPIGSAPPLPQRSNDAETSVTNNQEKSEMYSIRHVNWSDRTGKLRQSPMLSQNENGPCPLLALVNALVLRANEDGETPVVRALKTREQISLGLLIQALFEELITCLGPDDEFPDIDALSRFLTMLHTGMNVNPRLTLVSLRFLFPFSLIILLTGTRKTEILLVYLNKQMIFDFTARLASPWYTAGWPIRRPMLMQRSCVLLSIMKTFSCCNFVKTTWKNA